MGHRPLGPSAEHNLRTLAELVYPHNRALAAEIASTIHETLEGLGLEAPAVAPVRTEERTEDLVDVLVLTAVERSGTLPAAVRPWLHAVFKRGHELGITMEAAGEGLSNT